VSVTNLKVNIAVFICLQSFSYIRSSGLLSVTVYTPVWVINLLYSLSWFNRNGIPLKGITYGAYISILNYESYHYALSRDMTQAAWIKQSTGGSGLWPVDGYMVYTDTDLE